MSLSSGMVGWLIMDENCVFSLLGSSFLGLELESMVELLPFTKEGFPFIEDDFPFTG